MAAGMGLPMVSCGSNDSGSGTDKRQVVDWRICTLNHAVRIATGEVESVDINDQAMTIDYTNSKLLSLSLLNSIPRSTKPDLLVINVPITKSETRALYRFNQPTPVSEFVTSLKGYIDFDNQRAKFDYVESNTWRVISIVGGGQAGVPELNFDNNTTRMTREGQDYSSLGVLCSFAINPVTNRATVKLMNFTFGDTSANFTQIVTEAATPATVEATTDGFRITGEALRTFAYHRNSDPQKPISDFVIDDLVADINLDSETLTLSMKLNDYTVTIEGGVR